MPGLRSGSVREANLRTILAHLHLHGPCTRSDIGRHTGLTRTAVADLVAELDAAALVHETQPDPDGSPGRPSSLVNPNPANMVLGIDLMLDEVGVSAVSFGGTVAASARLRRTRDDLSLAATMNLVADLVGQVRAELTAAAVVRAVGVAVPGLVADGGDGGDGQVVMAPNLGWQGVALADELADLPGIGGLPVSVANEADLGALAEHRRGVAQGCDPVLYLSGEVGIGGGLLIGGRIHRGRRGFAGEVGHIPVNPSGRRCSCGAIGCFETEAGAVPLLTRAGLDPHGGWPAIEALTAAAEQGDRLVRTALDEEARWLAVGLAGPLTIIDPEIVVLGGVYGFIFPLLADRLEIELAQRVLPTVPGRAPVVAPALGAEALVRGAAELAWDRVLTHLPDEVVRR